MRTMEDKFYSGLGDTGGRVGGKRGGFDEEIDDRFVID
jgi:hypothetical protein